MNPFARSEPSGAAESVRASSFDRSCLERSGFGWVEAAEFGRGSARLIERMAN